MPFALFVECIKISNVKPGSPKLCCQTTYPRVTQHATGLRGQPLGRAELTGRGSRSQFDVGLRSPEKITETAGDLPVANRCLQLASCCLLSAVKVSGSNKDVASVRRMASSCGNSC